MTLESMLEELATACTDLQDEATYVIARTETLFALPGISTNTLYHLDPSCVPGLDVCISDTRTRDGSIRINNCTVCFAGANEDLRANAAITYLLTQISLVGSSYLQILKDGALFPADRNNIFAEVAYLFEKAAAMDTLTDTMLSLDGKRFAQKIFDSVFLLLSDIAKLGPKVNYLWEEKDSVLIATSLTGDPAPIRGLARNTITITEFLATFADTLVIQYGGIWVYRVPFSSLQYTLPEKGAPLNVDKPLTRDLMKMAVVLTKDGMSVSDAVNTALALQQ